MAAPAAVAAPTLEAVDGKSIRVKWHKNPAAHFAVVSLKIVGTSKWLRVDAVSGKLDKPDAGSTFMLIIFFGVLAATSSMSTPPSVEHTNETLEVFRSTNSAR